MFKSQKDKVKEIVRLIDEGRDEWRKAAFYSDPDVLEILNTLYHRWELNDMKGLPLDYASEEEINILYKKARSLTRSEVEFRRRSFIRKSLALDSREK